MAAMKWRICKIALCFGLVLVVTGCSGVRLSSVLREIDRYHEQQRDSQVTINRNGQHVVQRGETVYRISSAYHVPMRQVIERNSLRPPYTLRVGQVLYIPMAKTHTVRRGETVYRIAKSHNVDMSALVRTNNLHVPYTIHIGQVLRLPGQTSSQVAKAPKTDAPVSKPSTSSSSTQQTAKAPVPPVRKPTTKPAPRPVSIPKPPPRQGRGLAWPVKGKIIVPFGSVAKGMRNDGINIAAKLGTSVQAAESGVVAYAGNELKGFGNMLLLKHDKGLITTYAHVDEIKVKRGTTVKRGQIIGSVGQTGSVTSPQLHFEVRQGSKAVDPKKYLN